MKCNECQEALSAYYDKVLDEKQTIDVEAHLKQCANCQNEYVQLQQMLNYLKDVDEEKIVVPPLLHKQMLEKVKKQKNKVRSLWPQRIGGMAAAVLVGVMLVRVQPLDLNEMKDQAESYTIAAKDQVEESADLEVAENTLPQDNISNDVVLSHGVAQARVMPEEQTASNAVIPEENESSRANEMTGSGSTAREVTPEKVEGLDVRAAVSVQIWEIALEDTEALTAYLESYTAACGAALKQQEEAGQVSFMIYDVSDTQSLFESLQTQSFTKDLIVIEETGKNIKIVVKA